MQHQMGAKEVEDATCKVLPEIDADATTLRETYNLVADALGRPRESLSHEHRSVIKKCVTNFFARQAGPTGARTAAKKTKEKSPQQMQNAKKASEKEAEDPRLIALKRLARAMCAGPSVFRGLGEVAVLDDKLSMLSQRLRNRGAEFKGSVPTAQEIARARAMRKRELDLDGIDTSNILSSADRKKRRILPW